MLLLERTCFSFCSKKTGGDELLAAAPPERQPRAGGHAAPGAAAPRARAPSDEGDAQSDGGGRVRQRRAGHHHA